MTSKIVQLDDLLLDLENPRIVRASSQTDALQKIIEDQDVKLLTLASSIVEEGGLNPMDRMLVIESEVPGKYIVLEGNRRLAALMILRTPSILSSIEIRPNLQRRLMALASEFDSGSEKELDVWIVPDRLTAASWLRQRHTGENKGAGIVDWNGVASARFRGTDPALQALDLVVRHGGLTSEEVADTNAKFPITTLDRLLSTPAVRALIGVEILERRLFTDLPLEQVIKPLTRIVRDLSNGSINVSGLKSKDQQVKYISTLGADLPDLSTKGGVKVAIDDLTDKERSTGEGGKGQPRTRSTAKKSKRSTLIPKEAVLNVTNPKIAEIEKELRTLALARYPHAISVLFRVFLEQSTDHYIERCGGDLTIEAKGGGRNLKKLRNKVEEAINLMINSGIKREALDGIRRGLDDKNSPLHMDTLHNYVHNSFYSPQVRELIVSWDNSRVYFEAIWSR